MPKGRPKVGRVKVNCAECGREVEKYLWQVKQNKTGRFFCSAAHARKHGTKPKTVAPKVCEWCGQEFESYSTGRFCSKEHYDAWQRRNQVQLTCEGCGREFVLSPSQAAHRTGQWCTRACEADSRLKRTLNRSHNGRPAVRDKAGYVRIYEPDHPRAMSGGWVFEHRHVMEQALGRHLERAEHVHHANGEKDDNRLENLVVLSHSDHSRHEGTLRWGALNQLQDELAEYRRRFGDLS